jgi:hypothetical protein
MRVPHTAGIRRSPFGRSTSGRLDRVFLTHANSHFG